MLYKVILTFESVDEILRCNHSSEFCREVFSFPVGFFLLGFWFWVLLGVKALTTNQRLKNLNYTTNKFIYKSALISFSTSPRLSSDTHAPTIPQLPLPYHTRSFNILAFVVPARNEHSTVLGQFLFVSIKQGFKLGEQQASKQLGKQLFMQEFSHVYLLSHRTYGICFSLYSNLRNLFSVNRRFSNLDDLSFL